MSPTIGAAVRPGRLAAVRRALWTGVLGCVLATNGCVQKEAVPLGGSWEVVWEQSPIPEAGGRHPFLWRRSSAVHVLVEGDTYVTKYIPEDCVLYVSLDSGHLGAACGDRQPLVLNPTVDSFRESHEQGFLDRDPLRINDHEERAIAEVLTRARLQPPLTNAWKMPMRPPR